LNQSVLNPVGRAVIRSLEQHVGQQPANQCHRRVVGEGRNAIDIADRRQHRRALLERIDRPLRSLQPRHAGIGVQRHD
jgi:hypothetical protein